MNMAKKKGAGRAQRTSRSRRLRRRLLVAHSQNVTAVGLERFGLNTSWSTLATYFSTRFAGLSDKQLAQIILAADLALDDKAQTQLKSHCFVPLERIKVDGVDDPPLSSSNQRRPLARDRTLRRCSTICSNRLSTLFKSNCDSVDWLAADTSSVMLNRDRHDRTSSRCSKTTGGQRTASEDDTLKERCPQNRKRKQLSSDDETGGSRRRLMHSSTDSEDSKENLNSNSDLTRVLGLPNLGNTCYLNSVLQVMRITPGFPQFLHMIFDFITRTELKKASSLSAIDKNLVISLHEIFQYLGCDPKFIKSFKYLKEQLDMFTDCVCRRFVVGQQHDSHEFLIWLVGELNGIGEHFMSSTKKGSKNSKTPSFTFQSFQGTIKQNTLCSGCNFNTFKKESFSDIKVPLYLDKSEDAHHLSFSDLIHRTEYLKDENQFYCNRCAKYTDASMQNTIADSPKILVIHINKPYELDSLVKGNRTLFRVPMELEYEAHEKYLLSKHKNKHKEKPVYRYIYKYKLYSLIIHHGSTISNGHYYSVINTENIDNKVSTRRKNACPCANPYSDILKIEWIKVDDNKARALSEVNLAKLLAVERPVDAPYLAFYIRYK